MKQSIDGPVVAEARVGWRVSEFCRSAGIGRSTFYALPKDRQPQSVKLGRSTIVVEQPEAWLRRVGAAVSGDSR